MSEFKIGDIVKFYRNVTRPIPVVGKIVDMGMDITYECEITDTRNYIITYEGSSFHINEKFIIGKVFTHEEEVNELKDAITNLKNEISDLEKLNKDLIGINNNLKKEITVLDNKLVWWKMINNNLVPTKNPCVDLPPIRVQRWV